MRTTIQQRRAELTFNEVKAAAIRVILREGVMSFTTAQIAKEAEVSIGTVYRYFRNRVDVLDYLVPGFTNRQTDEFQFDLEKLQEDAERAAARERGEEGVQADPGFYPSHPSFQSLQQAS
jgi:AcrR family transcriptional regulator